MSQANLFVPIISRHTLSSLKFIKSAQAIPTSVVALRYKMVLVAVNA